MYELARYAHAVLSFVGTMLSFYVICLQRKHELCFPNLCLERQDPKYSALVSVI